MIPGEVINKDELIFEIDFHDGYTLRQLFEFLRLALPCAPLTINSKGIYLERGNGQNTMLVRLFINRKNLIKYYINEEKFNDKGCNQHKVNINIAFFLEQIKNISKRDGITIYQSSDYRDYVFGKALGGGKLLSQGVIYFRTQAYEHISYEVEDGVKENDLPNHVIPLVSFCTICSGIAKTKNNSAIIVYPNGVRIVTYTQTGSMGRNDTWGNCDDSQKKFVTKVSHSDMKALSKMINLNPNGIVRVYSKKNQITRLEVPCGVFAELTVILQGKND